MLSWCDDPTHQPGHKDLPGVRLEPRLLLVEHATAVNASYVQTPVTAVSELNWPKGCGCPDRRYLVARNDLTAYLRTRDAHTLTQALRRHPHGLLYGVPVPDQVAVGGVTVDAHLRIAGRTPPTITWLISVGAQPVAAPVTTSIDEQLPADLAEFVLRTGAAGAAALDHCATPGTPQDLRSLLAAIADTLA